MPIQKFAPMTKNFPTFDCDAHVTEPPWLWERAKDHLTKDELEALKDSIWFDSESQQLIVNGFAGSRPRLAAYRRHPPACSTCSQLAGPGLKHDIQRALNVRNLKRKTALTKEQAAYLDHQRLLRTQAAPARHGHPRYRPGDDHPHRYRYLSRGFRMPPARSAMCKAYNDWAYRVLPGGSRADLLRRAAADAKPASSPSRSFIGWRQGLPRRLDPPDRRDGQLSDSAQVRAPVAGDGRDRRGLRDASVSGLRLAQAAGLYRATLGRRADQSDRDVIGAAAFLL